VTNDPSNGQWLYNRGLAKSRLNKVEEAINDYTKALDRIEPDSKDQIY